MLILNLENVLFTVYTPLLFSYLLYACVKHLLLYSSFFLLPPTSRPRIIIIYYDLPSNKDTTGINKGKQEGGEARAAIRFHSSWWFDLVYYIRTVQEYSRRVLNEQLKALVFFFLHVFCLRIRYVFHDLFQFFQDWKATCKSPRAGRTDCRFFQSCQVPPLLGRARL